MFRRGSSFLKKFNKKIDGCVENNRQQAVAWSNPNDNEEPWTTLVYVSELEPHNVMEKSRSIKNFTSPTKISTLKTHIDNLPDFPLVSTNDSAEHVPPKGSPPNSPMSQTSNSGSTERIPPKDATPSSPSNQTSTGKKKDMLALHNQTSIALTKLNFLQDPSQKNLLKTLTSMELDY